jgi:hypothetical protein
MTIIMGDDDGDYDGRDLTELSLVSRRTSAAHVHQGHIISMAGKAEKKGTRCSHCAFRSASGIILYHCCCRRCISKAVCNVSFDSMHTFVRLREKFDPTADDFLPHLIINSILFSSKRHLLIF